jgi:hypothetical protein
MSACRKPGKNDESSLRSGDGGDPQLIRNSGEIDNAPFKTEGAPGLMIGTEPNADPKRTKRTQPVAGNLRLLVTQVKGNTKAVLYRAVTAGSLAIGRLSSIFPCTALLSNPFLTSATTARTMPKNRRSDVSGIRRSKLTAGNNPP